MKENKRNNFNLVTTKTDKYTRILSKWLKEPSVKRVTTNDLCETYYKSSDPAYSQNPNSIVVETPFYTGLDAITGHSVVIHKENVLLVQALTIDYVRFVIDQAGLKYNDNMLDEVELALYSDLYSDLSNQNESKVKFPTEGLSRFALEYRSFQLNNQLKEMHNNE